MLSLTDLACNFGDHKPCWKRVTTFFQSHIILTWLCYQYLSRFLSQILQSVLSESFSIDVLLSKFDSLRSYGSEKITAQKVSKYGFFSGPYFPVFQLKREIYFVKKLRKNSVFGHFSRSECLYICYLNNFLSSGIRHTGNLLYCVYRNQWSQNVSTNFKVSINLHLQR